jgi:hypothetical protein
MDVRMKMGKLAGTVQAVYNYPSTDALEVRLIDSVRVTLPLIPDCVIRVDKKARSVFVRKIFWKSFCKLFLVNHLFDILTLFPSMFEGSFPTVLLNVLLIKDWLQSNYTNSGLFG